MSIETIGRHIGADSTGTFITTPHQSWRMIDYGQAGFVSEDPAFGPYMVSTESLYGKVVNDLVHTPASMRSFGIAQLSKLRGEGSIPNITNFITAGGNISQLPLIKFIADELRADVHMHLAYIIAQSITDTSHGPIRHVTDMEAEGLAGAQVFHETRKLQTYELGGITDVLQKYGIAIDCNGLVPGVEIPPAIESGKPFVNADNYQYVIAEIYEMFSGYEDHPDASTAKKAREIVERLRRLGRFSEVLKVDDEGHIVFLYPSDALFFQKCQMLASTEDWKDPIGRVTTHMYVQDLKYHKLHRTLPHMDTVDNGHTMHPFDYMYYVDDDIVSAQMTADTGEYPYLYISRNLKKHIAQEERERYVRYKLPRYAEFLCDDEAVDYPNEMINGHVVSYGPTSSRIEVLKHAEVGERPITASTGAILADRALQTKEGVTYILDPLKNRVVRPYTVGKRGNRVFIDELDINDGAENYKIARASKSLFEQHQRLQWQQLIVRLVTTQDYAKTLRETFNKTATSYESLKQIQAGNRMSSDQIRRMIGLAATTARVSAIESGLLVIAA